MITPEAMREMADSLDDEAMCKMQRTFGSGCDSPSCAISGNLASDAAAMLRSIAAEREADDSIQNELYAGILRLKSIMVKNGWIEE